MIVAKCRYTKPEDVPIDAINRVLNSLFSIGLCYILYPDVSKEERTFIILTTNIFQFISVDEYISEMSNYPDPAIAKRWALHRLDKVKETMDLK